MVIAVQKGGRPRKPVNAESLGLSDPLWQLTRKCWSEPPSTRPTAQQLLHCLEDASRTWVPPLEYPISGGLDGGAGLDLTSGDERSIVAIALASCLFVLLISTVCIFRSPLPE